MLVKLSQILTYAVVSFLLAFVLYPLYINWLKRLKIGKTIREESVTGDKATIFSSLHAHKAGTPNIGGGLFLGVVLLMVVVSLLLQHFGLINNSLITRQETYIVLFSFFAFGIL
jgi:phospho-N-acetylmuramoyl-pentapeptide-transferase